MDSVSVTWSAQAGFRLAAGDSRVLIDPSGSAAILLPARARPITLALPLIRARCGADRQNPSPATATGPSLPRVCLHATVTTSSASCVHHPRAGD